MPKDDSRKSDVDNRSRQLDPEHPAFWKSRGEETRPEDWRQRLEDGRPPVKPEGRS